MQYQTKIEIPASPSAVWEVLTDASAYPDWEPNITKVEGSISLGSKLTIHTKLSSRAFPVKVTTLDKDSTMVWTGGMPLGLFKGVRTFSLTPAGEGCEFSMVEVFSGPLLPLIGKTIPDLSESFEQFAAALKQRVTV